MDDSDVDSFHYAKQETGNNGNEASQAEEAKSATLKSEPAGGKKAAAKGGKK